MRLGITGPTVMIGRMVRLDMTGWDNSTGSLESTGLTGSSGLNGLDGLDG